MGQPLPMSGGSSASSIPAPRRAATDIVKAEARRTRAAALYAAFPSIEVRRDQYGIITGQSLMHMKAGDRVRFSREFVHGSASDSCLKNVSRTTRGPDPECLFKFTDVRPDVPEAPRQLAPATGSAWSYPQTNVRPRAGDEQVW
jgi:hypothetical protein